MYRIEIAPGEETALRSVEEIAVGIRNGVITPKARIYHQSAGTWLPIEMHPHYQAALKSQASMAGTAVTSGAAAMMSRPATYLPSVFETAAASKTAYPDPAAHPPALAAAVVSPELVAVLSEPVDDAEPDSSLALLTAGPERVPESNSDTGMEPVAETEIASAGVPVRIVTRTGGRMLMVVVVGIVAVVAGAGMSGALPSFGRSPRPGLIATDEMGDVPAAASVATPATSPAVAPPAVSVLPGASIRAAHRRVEGATVGFPTVDSSMPSTASSSATAPVVSSSVSGDLAGAAIAPAPLGLDLPATGFSPDSLTLPTRPLTDSSGSSAIDRIRKAIIAPRRS